MRKFNLMYQFSPLKKGRIQLLERLVIAAEAGIQVFSGSLFSQGQVWIPVFTGMTTWLRQKKNFFKELKRLSFLRKQESRSYFLNLMNSKGISVLFLVIAMLLMVTIGYVFSYLIPMKQKTVKFPIYSTQAFFIAQSGAEFAIRYASGQGWRGATDVILDLERLDNIQQNLGNGRFTITYDSSTDGTLTSTGEITNSSERRIISLTRFTRFLRLIFNTPDPCRRPPAAGLPPGAPSRNNAARFYIQNVRRTNVILNRFSASWAGGAGFLQRIYMDEGTGWNLKYNGNYATGTPPPIVNFNQASPNDQQTITPNQVITVLIYWDFNLTGDTNIIITFYSTAGEEYTFNLDPQGDGLPTC